MAEKNLDFDTVIDRTHTNSLKYDFAVQRGKPKDVLPLWVADMDFQVSSYIQEALAGSVAHGIFGYSEAAGSYFEAVAGWMGRHYGWNVEEPWLVKTPGIVFALAQAVRDGYAATVIFVIQMRGVTSFTPNRRTHAAFAEALQRAQQAGVQVLAYDCDVTPDSLCLGKQIPCCI